MTDTCPPTIEPFGFGYPGGQCSTDSDCVFAGSRCVDGIGGGTCVIGCSGTPTSGYACTDPPAPAPTTLCVDTSAFESRAGVMSEIASDGVCVASCDYVHFPQTGCRAGLFCERRFRPNHTKQDEVCMPGAWTAGLAVQSGRVAGVDDTQRGAAAEPYATLVQSACGAAFESIDAGTFTALANTLLALDVAGRTIAWERLCSAPSELPDRYGMRQRAAAHQAFVLRGSKAKVADWIAIGSFGDVAARDVLKEGPLFETRTMLYANNSTSTHYVYVDDADDKPTYLPNRGRYFGWVDGKEWRPLDTELEPNVDYRMSRLHEAGRFQRQWARTETIAYLADLVRGHLLRTGWMLGVGDISRPNGGPLDGHVSHDVGLDADLYFMSFDRDGEGRALLDTEKLWINQCTHTSTWDCWYFEATSHALESGLDPSMDTILSQLAQWVYDHNVGPTWFVQHDVPVLSGFRAMDSDKNDDGTRDVPQYVDASNDAALGWPVHDNHIHIRLSFP